MLTNEEIRELKHLHIVAGRKVNEMFAGEYRSAFRGRGMEFDEVRPYVPGDDIRHIDWNVTARTNEAHIKIFKEERQLTVVLVVDVSGSTRVGSGGRDGRTDRRLQIARVAGGIAYAGIRNQDRIGLVTFSDRVESYLSPRRTRGHVWSVIQKVFAGYGRGRETDIAEALRFVHQAQRRRAVVVLISDFLDPGPWADVLGSLTRRHKVHAIAIHDPLDEGLARLGLMNVIDAETGRRRVVHGRYFSARESLESRLDILRRSGASAVAIATGDDAFHVLHQHFRREGLRR
jgi:uncharacterized protein (DUF58 family)